MTACTQLDPLIAQRASGPLDPADTLRLDAHLAGCERCRAELAAYEQTFGLARLPPPSEAERAAIAQLAVRVRAELRRGRATKPSWRPLVLGFAAAAAVALAVVVATRSGPSPSTTGGGGGAAVTASAWQEPDPEALLRVVEREHAELAIASEEPLDRAELIADAAWGKAFEEE